MNGIPPFIIERKSPRKGTKTIELFFQLCYFCTCIERKSPRKGTKTTPLFDATVELIQIERKSPRKGTKTNLLISMLLSMFH